MQDKRSSELVILIAAKIMNERKIEIPDLNKPEVFQELINETENRLNKLKIDCKQN